VALLFADAFDRPDWFDAASPFTHTPNAPLRTVTAAPILAIASSALVGSALGFAGFRRRDAGY
jgi:ABC-2 type transport system permease protein